MKLMVYAIPLGRTPWDSSGASSLDNYQKKLIRNLDDSLPWVKEKRDEEIRERLRKPPQVTKPITLG